MNLFSQCIRGISSIATRSEERDPTALLPPVSGQGLCRFRAISQPLSTLSHALIFVKHVYEKPEHGCAPAFCLIGFRTFALGRDSV